MFPFRKIAKKHHADVPIHVKTNLKICVFTIASIQCESSECLQAASSLLRAMDQTADPCEDFHQYACGGWLKETPIPPGYPVWDRFQEMSYKNMYMLKNLIGNIFIPLS